MEPSEFSVSTETRDGCHVITVCGELDELTAPALHEELERADGNQAVVDLSNVSFISSRALHVLLRPRPQGRPAVVCPSGSVSRILDIVGARRAIPVFPDLPSALMSLSLADGNRQQRTTPSRLRARLRR